MNLNILLQTANDIVSILSIESVSIFGVLILIIIYLLWEKTQIAKKHDKEKDDLKSEVDKARDKIENEYQKSNADIKIIIEKYHTMSTKVLEFLYNKL